MTCSSGFASAATYPQKEPYIILARFFDTEVEDIRLYFRVDERFFLDRGKGVFEKLIEEVIEKVSERGKQSKLKESKLLFVPKSWAVVGMAASNNDSWENDRALIGRNPGDLYETWVRKDQLNHQL